MKNFSAGFSFVLKAIAPLVLVITTFVLLFLALSVYDQFRTNQDRQVGAKLLQNMEFENNCQTIVNAGQKFTVKFNFKNQNEGPVTLLAIKIDQSLLRLEEKQFLKALSLEPDFSKLEDPRDGFLTYTFENTFVKETSSGQIAINWQAAARAQAQAKTNTIVVYEGSIFFEFEHQITFEAPCEIQVRYS